MNRSRFASLRTTTLATLLSCAACASTAGAGDASVASDVPDALAADAVATEASVTVARCTENYVRAGGCPNCPGQLGELCSIDESRCECFAGTGLASPSVWICAGPGAWTNADACPATPPSLGDACSTAASCRYLVGGRVAVARCFEGRWGPQPYTCGP